MKMLDFSKQKKIFDIVSSEGSGCHVSFREGRLGLNPLGQLRNPATKWGDEMGDQVDMTFFVEMPNSWFDHSGVICAERVFMVFSWVSNVRTKHNAKLSK